VSRSGEPPESQEPWRRAWRAAAAVLAPDELEALRAALLVDDRLVSAARLQIVLPDERHVARARRVLGARDADRGEQKRKRRCSGTSANAHGRIPPWNGWLC